MESKPVKYQNYLVVGVICLLCGISVSLVQYKIPTIMPNIMEQFSMTASGAAWTMSIFTLVGIFLAIPVGALAKKIGAKNVMLLAAGVIIVGSILGVCAASGGFLIFSRAIEGCALTMITTCGVIVIQQTVAPERIGSAMGIWGVWGSAGSVIAGWITPSVFAALGFKGLWISYACFALVAAALLFFIVKVPKPAKAAPQSETEAVAVADAAAYKPRYRDVFTPDMVKLFICFCGFNIVLLAILSMLPTILQTKGFSATASGFVSTLPMLLSLIASPVFGMLSDRISWKPLTVASVFLLGPCCLILYNSTGIVMWVTCVVLGLIGLGSMAMMLVALSKLTPRPELVEMATAVFITVQGVGQFLGSWLVQILLGPDFSRMLLAGIVICVLALAGTAAMALVKGGDSKEEPAA